MLMITISVITSALTAKIVATYYFKKVDGYVKEMCEMTTKSNEHTLAILKNHQVAEISTEDTAGKDSSAQECSELQEIHY